MHTHGELRIEPSQEVLSATREWLGTIRAALGPEFLAAFLTGSVLTQGFDRKHSRINVLVVARALEIPTLDAVHDALTATSEFDPLFLTRTQIVKSLDSFPIEWMEIKERHLLIEGEEIFDALEVPARYLRLQCEHELRGRQIQLRQTYLLSSRAPADLARVLKSGASSFATLFRTLLRLRGESPPADNTRVIERVSDLFQLDAQGLLGAHLVRYSARDYKPDEMLAIYQRFLTQVERLVIAIDQLPV